MITELEEAYDHIRSGGSGFYEQKRGLIAVWGKEAVQFLDGLITNDMKTLADGGQMLAAFPNAQGRLLAVVRVLRQGDRFLIETEDATREKVFQNLFRFTFAGDFFVEDLSDQLSYLELIGASKIGLDEFGQFGFRGETFATFKNFRDNGLVVFLPQTQLQEDFLDEMGGRPIFADDLYEVLRIESGIPKYGIDMDETTIVPELGLDGLISYNKGCYIGQEIIARIHFRGHVAKQLTGLVLSDDAKPDLANVELTTADGKNAGRVTSTTISPKLDRTIALAYVRYDYLAEGTRLIAGDAEAVVAKLPFV